MYNEKCDCFIQNSFRNFQSNEIFLFILFKYLFKYSVNQCITKMCFRWDDWTCYTLSL